MFRNCSYDTFVLARIASAYFKGIFKANSKKLFASNKVQPQRISIIFSTYPCFFAKHLKSLNVRLPMIILDYQKKQIDYFLIKRI